MNDFLIGILVTIVIILFLEIFRQFDKKIIATLTLTGIAFIYIGFVWRDIFELFVVSISVLVFMLFSYYGYTRSYIFIILGLILHGLWDLVFPNFSNSIPKGYDIFCLTVDFLLAAYFYIRLKSDN